VEGSHPKNHLALLADATGFGAQTTTLALVLLPVVLFLGIAAHGRLVEINREEVELSLAMNRLRHAYLKIAPALEPYFTTGHHDDERGLAASYLAGGLDPNSGQRQQCRRGRGDQRLELAVELVELGLELLPAAGQGPQGGLGGGGGAGEWPGP
jgi:hypothetical protein